MVVLTLLNCSKEVHYRLHSLSSANIFELSNLSDSPKRISHHRCSVRIGVLRNFAKFTRKHLCQSHFFNKVADLQATLLKKWLWHRCFPVNFAEFLRTPFLQNTGRVLQDVKKLNKKIRLNWTIRLVLTMALRTAKNQWTSKGGRKVSI